MASIARFIAEPEGPFTLPDPQSPLSTQRVQKIFTGIRALGVVAVSLPVIFFRTTQVGTPEFTVRLNNAPLFEEQPLSGDGPHAWHTIIPIQTLTPENNEIVLEVSGHVDVDNSGNVRRGGVTFSDIVIMYRAELRSLEPDFPDPPILNPVSPVPG